MAAASLFLAAVPAAQATDAKPELRGQTWDSIKHMPDWSGMWTPGRPPAGETQPARPGAGGGPGGFMFGFGVPLTPKYAAIRDKRMLAVRGEGEKGLEGVPLSNSGFCIPSGVPEIMGQVSHEYLFSPGRVTMLMENSEIRRIWTDGRGHPSDDDSNPSFSGHSIGHWEGDTLVVDTIQIFPEAEMFIGQHVTDKTHIVERFTRIGDKMKVETTITDPELLTKPWVFTHWYDREDREAVDYERCTLADRVKKGDGRLLGINFDVNKPAAGDPK